MNGVLHHKLAVCTDNYTLIALLAAHGQPEAPNGVRLADLLRRPGVTYEELAPLDPERPELTAEHGYLVICIVSVVCVLVELWIFKRKKWF